MRLRKRLDLGHQGPHVVVEPARKLERVDVVGGVDEDGRRAPLAQPAGHRLEPVLPAGDRARIVVPADVADDGLSGESPLPQGQTGLLGPRLPFGRARRRVPEQHGGVERGPFGVGQPKRPLQLLLRSRVLEELAVAHLHAVAVLAREPAQEAGQRAQVGRAERGRQLDPERVGPRPQGLDRGQESAQQIVDAGQAALVRDRPRQLKHKPEVGRGLLGPRVHNFGSRRRVEGGVPLHRIAPGRVRAQTLAGGQRVRQVPALPGCVAPHRAADVERPYVCAGQNAEIVQSTVGHVNETP